MNRFEKLIQDARVQCMPWKAEIICCAKAYIDANRALKGQRYGYLSVYHQSECTPERKEYLMLQDVYKKALSALWMATDVEYGNDEISNAAWEWRYWKVMARKCCWYQTFATPNHFAEETMHKLQNAETTLMAVCGLGDYYNPTSHHTEKCFSN